MHVCSCHLAKVARCSTARYVLPCLSDATTKEGEEKVEENYCGVWDRKGRGRVGAATFVRLVSATRDRRTGSANRSRSSRRTRTRKLTARKHLSRPRYLYNTLGVLLLLLLLLPHPSSHHLYIQFLIEDRSIRIPIARRGSADSFFVSID